MNVDTILSPVRHFLETIIVQEEEGSKSLSNGLYNTMMIGESLPFFMSTNNHPLII